MFKKSDNRNVWELSIKTLKAKLLNLNKRLLKLLINSLYKKLQLGYGVIVWQLRLNEIAYISFRKSVWHMVILEQ